MTTTVPQKPATPAGNGEVEPRTAQEWISRGQAVLIDVREPDEHRAERIPASRLMPLSRFSPQQLNELGAKRIVLHCKGGARSAQAVRLAAGCDAEILSLAGGIQAWKQDGLPVETAPGPCPMSVMRQTQLVIGAGVLVGAAAGYLVHSAWLVLPAFFGAGLLVAGMTGTCGLAAVLSRMPWNRARGAGGCPGACR